MSAPCTPQAAAFLSLDVASTLTGICMRKGFTFGTAQRIASQLIGYPIYTHELAHEPTQDAFVEEGYRQFPDMPRRDDVQRDWNAASLQVLGSYGPSVIVQRGPHQRRESPIATLRAIAPGKPIIAIDLTKEEDEHGQRSK